MLKGATGVTCGYAGFKKIQIHGSASKALALPPREPEFNPRTQAKRASVMTRAYDHNIGDRKVRGAP